MATTAQSIHHATGPRTEAGKAISSQNATKHGLAAGILFLPTENPADFHALHESLRAEHNPTGVTQSLLVADMVRHHWLMDRAIRLQTLAMVQNDFKKLDLLLRYQTANHRAFHKSLATLQLLRKEFVSKSVAAPHIIPAKPSKIQLASAQFQESQQPIPHPTDAPLPNAAAAVPLPPL